MRYLTVDGMLSGTGIRDTVDGGFVSPASLSISELLAETIAVWCREYEVMQTSGFKDQQEAERLDEQGVRIARQLRMELPETKIDYYSNAKLKRIAFE